MDSGLSIPPPELAAASGETAPKRPRGDEHDGGGATAAHDRDAMSVLVQLFAVLADGLDRHVGVDETMIGHFYVHRETFRLVTFDSRKNPGLKYDAAKHAHLPEMLYDAVERFREAAGAKAEPYITENLGKLAWKGGASEKPDGE
jgi:hypothetical protein